MSWIEPVTLNGHHAILEPLSRAHHDAMNEATKDGELWKLWYTTIPEPADMMREIDRRLDLQAGNSMLPFAVLDINRCVVGMTTYMNIDTYNKRVEIGSTWYAERVHRSALNTECKLMLLQHAFETLGCIAVEFWTLFFNRRSRRAIERLGAKLDGVLRNHQYHSDGTLRDTCVYSVIQSEWPTVSTHLKHELSRHGTDTT